MLLLDVFLYVFICFYIIFYGVRLKQVFGDTALESPKSLFEIPERVRVAVFCVPFKIEAKHGNLYTVISGPFPLGLEP